MANRTVEMGGVWAAGAGDPPAVPVSGTTYADSAIDEPAIIAGWPFSEIVESAKFNEVMRRITALISLAEEWGVLPWSTLTTYAAGARVLGSDFKLYVALGATTGDDPTISPAQWGSDELADHAAETAAHGATSAATGSRIVVRDAAGRAKIAAPSASDDIARKDTVDTHGALTAPHSASASATANRLALRDSGGRLEAAAGVSGNDLVNYTQWLGGVPRAWHDVLSIRSRGTTYVNSYGKEMLVSISFQPAAASGSGILVGGVTIGGFGNSQTHSMVTFPVPAGSNYQITGNANIDAWAEYR